MLEWLKTTDALGDILYVKGNYNSSFNTEDFYLQQLKFHMLEPNLQRVSNTKSNSTTLGP